MPSNTSTSPNKKSTSNPEQARGLSAQRPTPDSSPTKSQRTSRVAHEKLEEWVRAELDKRVQSKVPRNYQEYLELINSIVKCPTPYPKQFRPVPRKRDFTTSSFMGPVARETNGSNSSLEKAKPKVRKNKKKMPPPPAHVKPPTSPPPSKQSRPKQPRIRLSILERSLRKGETLEEYLENAEIADESISQAQLSTDGSETGTWLRRSQPELDKEELIKRETEKLLAMRRRREEAQRLAELKRQQQLELQRRMEAEKRKKEMTKLALLEQKLRLQKERKEKTTKQVHSDTTSKRLATGGEVAVPSSPVSPTKNSEAIAVVGSTNSLAPPSTSQSSVTGISEATPLPTATTMEQPLAGAEGSPNCSPIAPPLSPSAAQNPLHSASISSLATAPLSPPRLLIQDDEERKRREEEEKIEEIKRRRLEEERKLEKRREERRKREEELARKKEEEEMLAKIEENRLRIKQQRDRVYKPPPIPPPQPQRAENTTRNEAGGFLTFTDELVGKQRKSLKKVVAVERNRKSTVLYGTGNTLMDEVAKRLSKKFTSIRSPEESPRDGGADDSFDSSPDSSPRPPTPASPASLATASPTIPRSPPVPRLQIPLAVVEEVQQVTVASADLPKAEPTSTPLEQESLPPPPPPPVIAEEQLPPPVCVAEVTSQTAELLPPLPPPIPNPSEAPSMALPPPPPPPESLLSDVEASASHVQPHSSPATTAAEPVSGNNNTQPQGVILPISQQLLRNRSKTPPALRPKTAEPMDELRTVFMLRNKRAEAKAAEAKTSPTTETPTTVNNIAISPPNTQSSPSTTEQQESQSSGPKWTKKPKANLPPEEEEKRKLELQKEYESTKKRLAELGIMSSEASTAPKNGEAITSNTLATTPLPAPSPESLRSATPARGSPHFSPSTLRKRIDLSAGTPSSPPPPAVLPIQSPQLSASSASPANAQPSASPSRQPSMRTLMPNASSLSLRPASPRVSITPAEDMPSAEKPPTQTLVEPSRQTPPSPSLADSPSAKDSPAVSYAQHSLQKQPSIPTIGKEVTPAATSTQLVELNAAATVAIQTPRAPTAQQAAETLGNVSDVTPTVTPRLSSTTLKPPLRTFDLHTAEQMANLKKRLEEAKKAREVLSSSADIAVLLRSPRGLSVSPRLETPPATPGGSLSPSPRPAESTASPGASPRPLMRQESKKQLTQSIKDRMFAKLQHSQSFAKLVEDKLTEDAKKVNLLSPRPLAKPGS